MRLCQFFLLFLVAPLLCEAGTGKVYQSKDADGNTVFSDMPSEGAQVIKVAPANSADPVEHIPALAPDKSSPTTQPATKLTTSGERDDREDDSPYWLGGSDDLDGRDEKLRDREPRRDTPIVDRPHVQPLPSGPGPARGGGGRR